MTDAQWDLIQRLAICRFYPGSWNKRFVTDLAAKPRTTILSPTQDLHLRRIAWEMRKQLGPNIAITRPPELGPSPEEQAYAKDLEKLRVWNTGAPIREKEVEDLWPE